MTISYSSLCSVLFLFVVTITKGQTAQWKVTPCDEFQSRFTTVLTTSDESTLCSGSYKSSDSSTGIFCIKVNNMGNKKLFISIPGLKSENFLMTESHGNILLSAEVDWNISNNIKAGDFSFSNDGAVKTYLVIRADSIGNIRWVNRVDNKKISAISINQQVFSIIAEDSLNCTYIRYRIDGTSMPVSEFPKGMNYKVIEGGDVLSIHDHATGSSLHKLNNKGEWLDSVHMVIEDMRFVTGTDKLIMVGSSGNEIAIVEVNEDLEKIEQFNLCQGSINRLTGIDNDNIIGFSGDSSELILNSYDDQSVDMRYGMPVLDPGSINGLSATASDIIIGYDIDGVSSLNSFTKSSLILSTKNENKPDYILFPNPVNNRLQLNPCLRSEISLLDCTGKMIRKWNTDLHCGLDLNVPSGIYLVRIKFHNTIQHHKIIVN